MIEAEKSLPPDHPKRCGACRQEKTLADFQVGQRRCRVCQNMKCAESEALHADRKKERAKRYCAENKEKKAEALRRHRKKNPEWWESWNRNYGKTAKGRASRVNIMHRRRLAVVSGSVTTEQMVEIEAKAKGVCHYCGDKAGRLTFDHVIPIAKGGKHEAENLVMACFRCNRTKGAKDPVDYAKSIGRLLI